MRKVLKIFLIMAILALVGTMGMFRWFIGQNNSYAGENPVEFGVNTDQAKKALIVYQPSKSGVTEQVSYGIAEALNDEGFYVLTDYPGPHLSTDISEYDAVIFGTPVYVGQPSEILLKYMVEAELGERQLVYLFSTGSVQNAPEFEKMMGALAGHPVKETHKFNTNDKADLAEEESQFGQLIARLDV